MITRISMLSLLVLLVVMTMIIDLAQATAIHAGNEGPSVNGHMNLTIENDLQTSSFHVRKHKDGTVRGSLEAKSRGQDTRIHADIDCLRIVGNNAYLSGTVTQVKGTFTSVGDGVWVRVIDNGEGNKNPTDQSTDVIVGVSFDCNINSSASLFTIEAGNIQVKP